MIRAMIRLCLHERVSRWNLQLKSRADSGTRARRSTLHDRGITQLFFFHSRINTEVDYTFYIFRSVHVEGRQQNLGKLGMRLRILGWSRFPGTLVRITHIPDRREGLRVIYQEIPQGKKIRRKVTVVVQTLDSMRNHGEVKK